MAVVPSLLVWLILPIAVQPAAGEGSGYVPKGSLDELVDLGLLARLRDPRIRPFVIGRDGTERIQGRTTPVDGPRPLGTGGLVAEIAGPGIVQWIVLTARKILPRSFDRAEIHLKVYLDGGKEPELVISLADLAAGRHPHFPRPLVGDAAGELFSSIPIAFRDGCRILLDGKGGILPGPGRRAYPAGRGGYLLISRGSLAGGSAEGLERAVATWSKPEDLISPDRVPTEKSEFAVDGIACNTHRFLMPAGPRTIRSLEIEPTDETSDAWRAVRLKLHWESEEGAPGVDVPLGFAFGQLPGVAPCQSLLVGANGPAWSNRFPMPYRRQAFLQIDSERAIRGTIRVRTVRGVAADAAYFRAAYREGVALKPPRVANPPIAMEFAFSGRGHYAGAMIAARSPAAGPDGSGSARLVMPGVGTELVIDVDRDELAGWDALPAQGRFRGLSVPGPRQAAAYRWHVADPIPFVRPIRATIEPDAEHRPTTDVHATVAMFWYSERPGPDPAGH